MIVLSKICHEGIETLGHSAPQAAVAGILSGMGIEAAVIAVEDPATQIRQMHLGDTSQLAGDRGFRIFHRGRVSLRRHLRTSAPFKESRPVVPRYSITPLPTTGA